MGRRRKWGVEGMRSEAFERRSWRILLPGGGGGASRGILILLLLLFFDVGGAKGARGVLGPLLDSGWVHPNLLSSPR